jgi:2-polyprenyl-3-methyl-5-hydroxy-6-metoxy-1,4-benzoquinol methylase
MRMADTAHNKVYRFGELSPTHRAVMSFVGHGSRVLEFGCGSGHMTRGFAEEMGCSVTAIEINAEEAENARPYAEQLIVGDIQDPKIWDRIRGPYDAVIFCDVLEHLADPWEVLRRARRVTGEGGQVVACVPNVAYYKIRKQLLCGRFDYTKYGILDDTHVRFFTAKTARALLTGTGYEITDFVRKFRAKTDRRLWRLCPNAFTYQFIIRAVPAKEK